MTDHRSHRETASPLPGPFRLAALVRFDAWVSCYFLVFPALSMVGGTAITAIAPHASPTVVLTASAAYFTPLLLAFGFALWRMAGLRKIASIGYVMAVDRSLNPFERMHYRSEIAWRGRRSTPLLRRDVVEALMIMRWHIRQARLDAIGSAQEASLAGVLSGAR